MLIELTDLGRALIDDMLADHVDNETGLLASLNPWRSAATRRTAAQAAHRPGRRARRAPGSAAQSRWLASAVANVSVNLDDSQVRPNQLARWRPSPRRSGILLFTRFLRHGNHSSTGLRLPRHQRAETSQMAIRFCDARLGTPDSARPGGGRRKQSLVGRSASRCPRQMRTPTPPGARSGW